MTTIPNPLTVEYLKAKDACADQVDLFAATFPAGMLLTEENLLTAARAGLNLHWAAFHLLPAPASKAYDEATATAYKVYNEAIAQADKAYREAIAPARKAYDEATATALWSIIRNLPGVAQ